MKSFLRKALSAIGSKLGGFLGIVEPLAEELEIKIAQGDIEGALKICDELDRRLDELPDVQVAGRELTSYVRNALASGGANPIEIAGTGLRVERLVDELEDVVTGHDEDDPVTSPLESTSGADPDEVEGTQE